MSDRARDAVARLDAALPSVFDSMFEGVQIIDRQWRYVYLNPAAAAHGRRTVDELVGRTMMDAYPGIDRTGMFALLERCMTERTPQQMVNEFSYPDGRTGWFDLRVSPVPMGILVLSVDVTAQRAAEEELHRSREDLATTLSCMAEGVITTDIDGRVTGMNPAAEALTGWPAAEAAGRQLDDLVSFVDQDTGRAADHPVQRVLREGTVRGFADDTVLVARDGVRTPISSSGAPIRQADGTVRGVVLALKNMKQEHELSNMLHQSQKMEAVGRLAGGVAHDFNNVLTVITGCADILLEEIPEGAPLREDAKEILEASRRASDLVRQLLTFSRHRPPEAATVDVGVVVSRMDGLLRRLLGERVDLEVRIARDRHPVRFDASRLEQIVMNLAVNARDAMPEGGSLTVQISNVELSREYARIHVDAHPGPHVLVAVTDTGAGMDEATRERVFEPFFTTKPKGVGTGLGLSTLYGQVKQAGGNVWLYSEPGRGTTFKIYLPRAEDGSEDIREDAETPAARAVGHETVLVVEDDPTVRHVIRTALERGGYEALEAEGPEEALRLCESHEGRIDLLLSDVVLPGMGGPALVRAMLKLRPELRIAYMSGYTDEALAHQGVVEAGAAFIDKPITPSALLAGLREALA